MIKRAAFVLALCAALFPISSLAASPDDATKTPIKHVIVVFAENRSFDHLFATYQPPKGQTVFNLLSESIVNQDGTPGPNFAKAAQYAALLNGTYDPAPANKKAYDKLPPLMTANAPEKAGADDPPFMSLDQAAAHDRGLSDGDTSLLLLGATGLPKHSIDTRLPNVNALPNGPYQMTPGIPSNAYASSPVHRFFQMWQQMDCSVNHASKDNPSGCLDDLFPWVEVSVGAGSNGKPQPAPFTDLTTGEGSTAMGFYNMAHGDAPYLRQLAEKYAVSDNYHQAAAGGSGANHIMLGMADMIWYSDDKGQPATPPANQIENPDPQKGTNNYYTQDGYKGGSYVACADAKAPGVGPILSYLSALPSKPKPNCEDGHYYLVNNYNPGYFGDGSVNTADPFTIPPSSVPTIGDALMAKNVSFRYYGEDWDNYVKNPKDSSYCTLCNFLQYTPTIMTDARLRQEHIGDLDRFYADLKSGTLPAVSFIKPSEFNDGHPTSSRIDIFESFARRLVTAVQMQPNIWKDTAIFITFDEAGGYWDSGYIQPLDFFGDGPRVPLIVVSPYAVGGRVVHSYSDHVSLIKFIEHNWDVAPISRRSRDNLPNPAADKDNPYVPTNGPAIGDLVDMFAFGK